MTFNGLADAVADFVGVLGADQVHLVGISFGGMIAQYAAARPRARSLADIAVDEPGVRARRHEPDEWRAARLAPLDLGREPADIADACSPRSPVRTSRADAMAGQIAAMARISAPALRRSIDCLITHDSRAVLPTITAPTLCLVGDLDDETPLAYAVAVADLIPGRGCAVIEGAGHLLNVEAPDAVNDAILDHIARRAARTEPHDRVAIHRRPFAAHFARCGLVDGETVAVLSETQSRAGARRDGTTGGAVVGRPRCSTSSCHAGERASGADPIDRSIAGDRRQPGVIAALRDGGPGDRLHGRGLLHAPELGEILGGGARVLMISNEHPDTFDRLAWDDDLPRRVALGHSAVARAARWSHGGGRHRTDGSPRRRVHRRLDRRDRRARFDRALAGRPGARVPGARLGQRDVVLAPGDLNLTFNRYVETPVTLSISDDHIVDINGKGVDAELFRVYLARSAIGRRTPPVMSDGA